MTPVPIVDLSKPKARAGDGYFTFLMNRFARRYTCLSQGSFAPLRQAS
jgi:hypothetical protein